MEAWVGHAVAVLSCHWSNSYKITYADGCFQAERRDNNHEVLLDETPEGLLRLIKAERSR
jgi:hypothetical protein